MAAGGAGPRQPGWWGIGVGSIGAAAWALSAADPMGPFGVHGGAARRLALQPGCPGGWAARPLLLAFTLPPRPLFRLGLTMPPAPMVTDDARIVDAKACQVESWVTSYRGVPSTRSSRPAISPATWSWPWAARAPMPMGTARPPMWCCRARRYCGPCKPMAGAWPWRPAAWAIHKQPHDAIGTPMRRSASHCAMTPCRCMPMSAGCAMGRLGVIV